MSTSVKRASELAPGDHILVAGGARVPQHGPIFKEVTDWQKRGDFIVTDVDGYAGPTFHHADLILVASR